MRSELLNTNMWKLGFVSWVVMELNVDQYSPTCCEARSQRSGHLRRVFPTLRVRHYVNVHLQEAIERPKPVPPRVRST